MRRIIAILSIALIAMLFVLYVRTPNGAPVVDGGTYKPTPYTVSYPQSAYNDLDIDEVRLYDLIQNWRVENGLEPYQEDERLCDIAEDRVNDTIDPNNVHAGFEQKMTNGTYSFVGDSISVSENVAYHTYISEGSEENILRSWLNSTEHAETLKKPYRYSCVRCENDNCIHIFSSFLEYPI